MLGGTEEHFVIIGEKECVLCLPPLYSSSCSINGSSSFRTELFSLRLAFEWVKLERMIAPLHLGWGWVELQMFAKGSEKTGHLFGDSQFLETSLVGEGTEQKEGNSYLIS